MNEQNTNGQHIVWHNDVVVKQFISYAVGCIMGRYSIDRKGLVLANQGDGIERFHELVPSTRFEPDSDGIVPLMGDDSPFSNKGKFRFILQCKFNDGRK